MFQDTGEFLIVAEIFKEDEPPCNNTITMEVFFAGILDHLSLHSFLLKFFVLIDNFFVDKLSHSLNY